MDSPYELRLRRALGEAPDPVARALLQAEYAAYLARIGAFADAEAILLELRREFGAGESGRVTIMLMLGEGLLAYFRDLDPVSQDRLARAHLLSVAARSGPLSALTSAWLAHIAFNLHRHDAMGRAIRSCVDTVSASDVQAKCRLSLTLGDAFLVSGQRATSRGWYSRARDYAIQLGDHAAIGALIYNQAALSVFGSRLASLDSPLDAEIIHGVAAEIKSATNYQGIARLASLHHLLDDAMASVYILQRRFGDALVLLERVIAANSPVSPSGHMVTTLCDAAFCQASLRREEEFNRLIGQIDMTQLARRTADDRAVAYGALHSAFSTFGRQAEALRCEREMRRGILEHSDRIAALSEILTPFHVPELIDEK